MSKLNGKELSYGVMHGTVHVPNMGQIGPVLTSTNDAMHKTVKMTVDEPFVILEVPIKNGRPMTVNVPIVNFSHMVMKEDLAKDSKT